MTQEFDLGYIRGATGPAGAQGPAGATGAQGPAGATPSISIGQVTAVGAGGTPYVTRRTGSPDLYPILDFGLPAAGGDMASATYDPNGRHQDVFAYCDARSARRTATVVVAAADSRDRNRADFVCDGQADHLTIAQAVAALPTGGGRVLLLEGSYHLDCTGVEADTFGDCTLIDISGDNVSICGQGRSTRLILDDDAADSGGVLMLSVTGAGFAAQGLALDGNSAENDGADIYGLYLSDSAADACLSFLLVENCSEAGFASLAEDAYLTGCALQGCGTGAALLSGGVHLRDCVISGCDHGVSVSGGRHSVCGCRIWGNEQSGIIASGGQRCLVCGNILWGQPLGLSLSGATDWMIYGNMIFRSATGSIWGSGEYPLRLSSCLRPHALGNYLYGKAASVEDCTGAVLAFSGSDWNPTA